MLTIRALTVAVALAPLAFSQATPLSEGDAIFNKADFAASEIAETITTKVDLELEKSIDLSTVDENTSILGNLQKSKELNATKITEIDSLIKGLSEGNIDLIKPNVKYESLRLVYLSQINYVHAKVEALSEMVRKVAAGTFETRVKEGSMLLGLISGSINEMIKEAKNGEDNFRLFVDNKLVQLGVSNAEFSYEVSDNIYTIEAKYPNIDSIDIISAIRQEDGEFRLVAFVPREFEAINEVIESLYQSAGAAEDISNELDRRLLTTEIITVKDKKSKIVTDSAKSNIDKAIKESR